MGPWSRSTRQWFELRWPHEVSAEQVAAMLLGLNGVSTPKRPDGLTLVAVGARRQVAHYLAVPRPRATGVRHQLEAAAPGLAASPLEQAPRLDVDRAWRCWANSRVRPLSTKKAEVVARGLITALASVDGDELLVMRWSLGPVHRPAAPPKAGRWRHELAPVLGKEIVDLVAGPKTADAEATAAFVQKQGQPGWHAALHLGVCAQGRRRQRQLFGRVAAAARTAQASGVQVGFRPAWPTDLARIRPYVSRNLLVNVAELEGLAGWPIGPTNVLPVTSERSRLLAPPHSRPAPTGRVVAEATFPGVATPLQLSARDALQHLHVIGPTGTGKSTLLLNLICQDMAAGRSVVVIEPNGDLVADVLERVPDDRVDDVVVIDPADPAPVGINPLAAGGVAGDLKADHLLTIFKSLYADSWGPRTQDILTAGLLTLAEAPGMSLAALPFLFTNEPFRRRIVARVDDPLALDQFWSWFEGLTADGRAEALAPVMNKVRSFLLRKPLRRIIGQTKPIFDMRNVYRSRTILLVNLAVGTLGPEGSALLGALVLSQLWQTALGRTVVPAARRHPVMVFLDEFQSFLHLPTDLADVLARARGLGVGLTLAHQHLAQLPASVKAATLANARSRVVFATNHEDAKALVGDDALLTPADIGGLGRYGVYASLLTDGERTPYASGRTVAPPPPVRSADEVRERSRRRWGRPAALVDAELEALVTVDSGEPAGGLRTGPRDGEPPFVVVPRNRPESS